MIPKGNPSAKTNNEITSFEIAAKRGHLTVCGSAVNLAWTRRSTHWTDVSHNAETKPQAKYVHRTIWGSQTNPVRNIERHQTQPKCH